MHSSRLYLFCVVLAVCSLFLMTAGAVSLSQRPAVSPADAGLAAWAFFQATHRTIAGIVGVLTLILAAWVWIAEPRRWMKRLAAVAAGAVVLESALGGFGLLDQLPKALGVAHALLAHLFVSTAILFAFATAPGWQKGLKRVRDSGTPSMRSIAVMTPVLVFAQVILGTAYRHQVLGVVPHIIGAIAVTACVLMAAVFAITQFTGHRPIQQASHLLLWVTLAQMLLGIAAYLSIMNVPANAIPDAQAVVFTAAHATLGGLVMAASLLFGVQIRRNTLPAHSLTVAQPHRGPQTEPAK